jgi:hypothetical protein
MSQRMISELEKESIKDTQHHATDQIDHKRRTIVRKIAVGSAALACCSALPTKWTTPLVEFGSLPAHATTSGTSIASIVEEVKREIEGTEAAAPEAAAAAGSGYANSERINLTGQIYIDGILRNKFVSNKLGPQYGKSMKIVFSSGRELGVPDTTKDVNSVSGRAYRPGGNYTYHKDVEKMEVYADPGDKSTYIDIFF